MGKKGAKGKKGGKKKAEAAPPPEEPTEYDELENEQIQDEIKLLQQKLEKARMDRNYVQLERDTIQTFYDVTLREVRECEQATLSKDREMESMEESHRVEVRVYVQKVKHLEYEHKNNVRRVGLEGQTAMHEEAEASLSRSADLRKLKRSLKQVISENDNASEERVKLMKDAHAKNLLKLRESFEDNMRVLKTKYSDRLDSLKADLELRRKVEIHEIEERKNLHINDLMANHDKAFGQIKNYYNDITKDNLKLIKSLKEEVTEMKKKAAANQKLMYDIARENKRLSEPLSVAVKEVEQLKHELKDYNKDKLSLRNTLARKQLLTKQLTSLANGHADLELKYQSCEEERNKLYTTFEATVQQVQRKAEFENLALERKLTNMRDNHQSKVTQLNELCKGVDPVMLSEVTRRLDEEIERRDRLVAELEYQVARVHKAHNDAVRTFREKLVALGIPEDQVLQSAQLVPSNTSSVPAGLVTKGV